MYASTEHTRTEEDCVKSSEGFQFWGQARHGQYSDMRSFGVDHKAGSLPQGRLASAWFLELLSVTRDRTRAYGNMTIGGLDIGSPENSSYCMLACGTQQQLRPQLGCQAYISEHHGPGTRM